MLRLDPSAAVALGQQGNLLAFLSPSLFSDLSLACARLSARCPPEAFFHFGLVRVPLCGLESLVHFQLPQGIASFFDPLIACIFSTCRRNPADPLASNPLQTATDFIPTFSPCTPLGRIVRISSFLFCCRIELLVIVQFTARAMADEGVYHREPSQTPSVPGKQQTPSERTQTAVDGTSIKQITPRPTYIGSELSRDSMLPHQLLARRETIELDDYFVGPRNLDRHSKWPMFMRIHGSVMPRLIIPLFFMACWSTLITCFSRWVHDCTCFNYSCVRSHVELARLISWSVGISSILLTVLGFVVGLSLSFRSSTAYERYTLVFGLYEMVCANRQPDMLKDGSIGLS